MDSALPYYKTDFFPFILSVTLSMYDLANACYNMD